MKIENKLKELMDNLAGSNIEGSNKMGWTIEADKATARLKLYEYTIRDRMQILATVKAENLDAALQLFSFGNLRLEFYFHGCATVEESGKVFGVTWRPIEHALAVNEHAALCEVAEDSENTLNELRHWHQWRCHTSPDYIDTDGYRICKGRIERQEKSIANLAALRK